MNAITQEIRNVFTTYEALKVDELVGDFNALFRKSAENFIEMGRIAYEAKNNG